MIFLDLDGPILDVSEKYHRVYSDVLAEEGFTPISKDQYWGAKRARVPDREILSLSGAAAFVDGFRSRRHERIETERYQRLDTIQPTARETLDWLRQHDAVVLITLRRSKAALDAELKWLGIREVFAEVLTSGEEREPRWTIKAELMRTFLGPDAARDGHVIVGDTETDILAGQALGMSTFGFCNGIRTRQLIERAAPTFIIDQLVELKSHISPGVQQ